jgi:hypothetical protein
MQQQQSKLFSRKQVGKQVPRPVRLLVTVALLVLIFFALFAGDWPTYLFSPARGGFNAGETLPASFGPPWISS